MKKLRAGVIGAGSWANTAHLPALAERDDVEIVGIARKGDDLLRKMADKYACSVASEDYRDVLNLECDVVVVASPSALHFEHVSAALASRAHVLCEKPMTIHPQHAWQLVDIAEQQQRQLLISFGWNYQPIVREAKRILSERPIGELEHLTVGMASQTRELLSNTGAYPDASPEAVPDQATWTTPSLSGGGYGQAQLSHALGLALHLSPLRAKSAFAFMSNPSSSSVELHDAIAYSFDNGAIGVVGGASSHVGAWGNKHELFVRGVGSRGQYLVDVHRERVYVCYDDGTEVDLPISAGAGAYNPYGPANALVDCALGKTSENCAPGRLGALTVEALALAYASAESGTAASRT